MPRFRSSLLKTPHIRAVFFTVISLILLSSTEAAIIAARSVSYTDIAAAVALARDGDTVNVPSGTITWATTLTITKNIQLIGAGEGQTIITENLPRPGNPPLIDVTLTREAPTASKYSFRLSGFTFTSAGTGNRGGYTPFLSIVGKSSYVANPTAALPAPLVLGCVSKVRVDHCRFDNLMGIPWKFNSVLGVMDHCSLNQIVKEQTEILMDNWTPTMKPDGSGPMTTLAQKAWGSWADDAFWGSDKFWYYEDCDFYTNPALDFNVMDNQEGARVVVRHCEFRGGNGGVASHGTESRAQPGIKQIEFYNNHLQVIRSFAQHRSGSALYFNNWSTSMQYGMALNHYRYDRPSPNWGIATGDNRYDDNVDNGAVLYSGTVTAVNGVDSITDSNQANFNNIVFDGHGYGIVNLDGGAANGSLTDPGWQYYGSHVWSVNNKTLGLVAESGYSPKFQVGHRYQIRKLRSMFGQVGQGKGNLINTSSGSNSYVTYTWPATSGAKAKAPMKKADGTYWPLEPCYSWNNWDDKYGQLQLGNASGRNKTLLEGRDYYNLGQLPSPSTSPSSTTAAPHNQVGYPARTYAKATDNFPMIGEPGKPNRVQYTPYTYPHPLTLDAAPSPTPTPPPPSPPSNLKVVPGS